MRPSLDPLVTHVLHMMTDHTAITKADSVIVAVSGGLDSLVLLHILASQHDRWPSGLHVATFDHGWRAESATDAAFVQGMAAAWGLPCTIGRMPPPDHMPQGREAAARTARYDFLVQVARNQGARTIVTAHHADDQTETILLHLLRGTGTHGLQGMSPYALLPGFDDIWLARPLLEITREQLATYAQQHNLTPRHDSSNDDPRYQRNALRREIVPQLKRFNLKFTHNLLRLASIVRDEQAYLSESLQRGLLAYAEQAPHCWQLPRDRFWDEHIALQKRYLWQAAQTLSQTPQDVTHERIMAALKIIREKRIGATIEIPGGVIVRLTQVYVIVEQVKTNKKP
jgi:tRNA(Ile)-lysidine synthase